MAQKPITTPQPKNKVASWRVFRDRALRGYKCDWNGNEAATSKTDHDMIAQLLRSRLVVIAFGFGTEEQIWLMRALPKTRLQSSHGRLARVLSLLFGVRIRGEMTAAHSIVHSIVSTVQSSPPSPKPRTGLELSVHEHFEPSVLFSLQALNPLQSLS